MTFDAHSNLALTTVAVAPSPAASGTSLTVASGKGAWFAVGQQVTVWPYGTMPSLANAEIARVTAISTDTFTITRAQEGTTARAIVAGDWIAASITAKVLTDVEDAIAAAQAAAIAASQPLDADLTAIAALSTTAYGRAFLALSGQSALMALLSAASESASGVVELATTAEAVAGSDTTRAVTAAGVAAAIAALVDSAPGTLDTLNELAAALGDDANFAATMTAALALKAPLASPTFTGTVTVPTPAAGDNSTKAASTAFVADGFVDATDALIKPSAGRSATYGSDLVSNDFSSGWTAGANWTLGSGTATATAGAGTLTANIAVTSGDRIAVEWSLGSGVGGSLGVALGSVSDSVDYWKTQGVMLVAPSTGTLTLTLTPTASWAGVLSAMHVRKIAPSAAGLVLADSAGNAVQEMRWPGSSNVGVGQAAQQALTTGSNNIGVGQAAQQALTTGSSNVGVGYTAQYALTTGSNNVGVGHAAQQALTTGSSNIGVGQAAQYALTTGSNNIGVGQAAQQALTTGSSNVGVGYTAQYALTTGSSNIGVGYAAQRALTTGSNNVGVGYAAQYALTTGSSNIGVGQAAQYAPNGNSANATTTASDQTTVGRESGQSSATQVDGITCLGYRSLAGVAYATALGYRSQALHAAGVALGDNTATTADRQVQIEDRHIELSEVTAPGNGGANTGRLYVEDNGSGKTRLVVKFPTGSAIVLATEV